MSICDAHSRSKSGTRAFQPAARNEYRVTVSDIAIVGGFIERVGIGSVKIAGLESICSEKR
eukprot:6184309-Pleurochrysis_carterae.AAC.6